MPEYWRNGGGGVGGPIVKNKTFFWFAGEKYVDNQPQQTTLLVPTAAELTGNFNGVTRNGAQVNIKDPLHRRCNVPRQPHSAEPAESGRRQAGELPAAGRHAGRQRQHRTSA